MLHFKIGVMIDVMRLRTHRLEECALLSMAEARGPPESKRKRESEQER